MQINLLWEAGHFCQFPEGLGTISLYISDLEVHFPLIWMWIWNVSLCMQWWSGALLQPFTSLMLSYVPGWSARSGNKCLLQTFHTPRYRSRASKRWAISIFWEAKSIEAFRHGLATLVFDAVISRLMTSVHSKLDLEAASTHCWRQRYSVAALATYAMTLHGYGLDAVTT
jgi:hypothetical protein